MSKRMQVYYTAVLGALGGLLGWWLIGSVATATWNLWLASTLVGAVLGLSIGGCVALTEGALMKRVIRRALRDMLVGALAGLLVGAVGLLIAEGGFLGIGGGLIARMGGCIGLSELPVNRQLWRTIYGTLGGLLGGALGGALYEGLTQLFRAQSDR